MALLFIFKLISVQDESFRLANIHMSQAFLKDVSQINSFPNKLVSFDLPKIVENGIM